MRIWLILIALLLIGTCSWMFLQETTEAFQGSSAVEAAPTWDVQSAYLNHQRNTFHVGEGGAQPGQLFVNTKYERKDIRGALTNPTDSALAGFKQLPEQKDPSYKFVHYYFTQNLDATCKDITHPAFLTRANADLSGCGWWVPNDSSTVSRATFGCEAGPYTETLKHGENGTWYWNKDAAMEAENRRLCARLTTCESIGTPLVIKHGSGSSTETYILICGFCKTTNQNTGGAKGFPLTGNGVALGYENNLCSEVLVTSSSECRTSGVTPDIRDDDGTVGGPVVPPRVVNVCNPVNGVLTKACYTGLAKDKGFTDAGGFLQWLNRPSGAQANPLFDYAASLLPTQLTSTVLSAITDGTATTSQATILFGNLQAMGARVIDSAEYRAVAWLMVGNPTFTDCDYKDDTMATTTGFRFNCVSQEFRKAGCQLSGTRAPKAGVSSTLGANTTWGYLKKTFADLYAAATDPTVRPETQDAAIAQCFGISLLRAHPASVYCSERGIEYYAFVDNQIVARYVSKSGLLTDPGSTGTDVSNIRAHLTGVSSAAASQVGYYARTLFSIGCTTDIGGSVSGNTGTYTITIRDAATGVVNFTQTVTATSWTTRLTDTTKRYMLEILWTAPASPATWNWGTPRCDYLMTNLQLFHLRQESKRPFVAMDFFKQFATPATADSNGIFKAADKALANFRVLGGRRCYTVSSTEATTGSLLYHDISGTPVTSFVHLRNLKGVTCMVYPIAFPCTLFDLRTQGKTGASEVAVQFLNPTTLTLTFGFGDSATKTIAVTDVSGAWMHVGLVLSTSDAGLLSYTVYVGGVAVSGGSGTYQLPGGISNYTYGGKSIQPFLAMRLFPGVGLSWFHVFAFPPTAADMVADTKANTETYNTPQEVLERPTLLDAPATDASFQPRYRSRIDTTKPYNLLTTLTGKKLADCHTACKTYVDPTGKGAVCTSYQHDAGAGGGTCTMYSFGTEVDAADIRYSTGQIVQEEVWQQTRLSLDVCVALYKTCVEAIVGYTQIQPAIALPATSAQATVDAQTVYALRLNLQNGLYTDADKKTMSDLSGVYCKIYPDTILGNLKTRSDANIKVVKDRLSGLTDVQKAIIQSDIKTSVTNLATPNVTVFGLEGVKKLCDYIVYIADVKIALEAQILLTDAKLGALTAIAIFRSLWSVVADMLQGGYEVMDGTTAVTENTIDTDEGIVTKGTENTEASLLVMQKKYADTLKRQLISKSQRALGDKRNAFVKAYEDITPADVRNYFVTGNTFEDVYTNRNNSDYLFSMDLGLTESYDNTGKLLETNLTDFIPYYTIYVKASIDLTTDIPLAQARYAAIGILIQYVNDRASIVEENKVLQKEKISLTGLPEIDIAVQRTAMKSNTMITDITGFNTSWSGYATQLLTNVRTCVDKQQTILGNLVTAGLFATNSTYSITDYSSAPFAQLIGVGMPIRQLDARLVDAQKAFEDIRSEVEIFRQIYARYNAMDVFKQLSTNTEFSNITYTYDMTPTGLNTLAGFYTGASSYKKRLQDMHLAIVRKLFQDVRKFKITYTAYSLTYKIHSSVLTVVELFQNIIIQNNGKTLKTLITECDIDTEILKTSSGFTTDSSTYTSRFDTIQSIYNKKYSDACNKILTAINENKNLLMNGCISSEINVPTENPKYIVMNRGSSYTFNHDTTKGYNQLDYILVGGGGNGGWGNGQSDEWGGGGGGSGRLYSSIDGKTFGYDQAGKSYTSLPQIGGSSISLDTAKTYKINITIGQPGQSTVMNVTDIAMNKSIATVSAAGGDTAGSGPYGNKGGNGFNGGGGGNSACGPNDTNNQGVGGTGHGGANGGSANDEYSGSGGSSYGGTGGSGQHANYCDKFSGIYMSGGGGGGGGVGGGRGGNGGKNGDGKDPSTCPGNGENWTGAGGGGGTAVGFVCGNTGKAGTPGSGGCGYVLLKLSYTGSSHIYNFLPDLEIDSSTNSIKSIIQNGVNLQTAVLTNTNFIYRTETNEYSTVTWGTPHSMPVTQFGMVWATAVGSRTSGKTVTVRIGTPVNSLFTIDSSGNTVFNGTIAETFTNPPRPHIQRGGIVKPTPALTPTSSYMPPPMSRAGSLQPAPLRSLSETGNSRFGSFGSNSIPLDMGLGMPILPPSTSVRWAESPLQQPWFSQESPQPVQQLRPQQSQQKQDPNKPQKPLEQLDYFWQRLQAGRFF